MHYRWLAALRRGLVLYIAYGPTDQYKIAPFIELPAGVQLLMPLAFDCYEDLRLAHKQACRASFLSNSPWQFTASLYQTLRRLGLSINEHTKIVGARAMLFNASHPQSSCCMMGIHHVGGDSRDTYMAVAACSMAAPLRKLERQAVGNAAHEMV
jgi:hypothetical protein